MNQGIVACGYCDCGQPITEVVDGTYTASNRCTCHVALSSNQESLSEGVKHDQDKPDMSLLSTIALVKVAKVMSFGKKKYTAHNWRGGFAWSRPLAAAARHLYAYIGGEDLDPESGLSHLAHACCCLFFILEFEETRKNLDDRYKEKK